MARMAGVPFLGISDNGAMSVWDIVCVHTIVGFQSNGNAAHFTTGAGGQIVQARDTKYRSAANLNGNWHVIAIENEDHGPAYGSWSGSNVPRFTAQQAEAIAKILVWAHKTHGIPLALIPDTKPGRRGVAYHRQGIDGNFTGPYGGRVSGGELWSSSFGKVCPGDARIAQLINEIIPRARVLAGQPQEEEVSTYPDIAEQNNCYTAVKNLFIDAAGGNRPEVVAALRQILGADAIAAQLAELSDDEANIIAAVRAMTVGGDVEALATALAPLLGPLIKSGVTAEQVEQAVSHVFARAAQTEGIA